MARRRSVLITGGSKGIGKGLAAGFFKSGYDVAICGRSVDDGQNTINELQGAGPGKLIFLKGNVAERNSINKVIDAIQQRFMGLDVVCANAGIFPSAYIRDSTNMALDEILATNVKGTIYTVQAALPLLRQSTAGRIVITSSITGPITGFPGWSYYGASKAAQLGFMRTAALECAADGITVNAVLPGNILTEGLEGMGKEYLAAMAASIPLGRLGDVKDIANAALFLAGEASGYITGQTIIVDGGQTLPESAQALGG
ncbi:3-oxoacyl-ACP reductase FabG [Acidithiobacillus ferrooxidans]|uniref:3-oxoacyl-ACP reductase FabG n=1 Tax=Acidithiobacillus ferrooxidans TaxID=920 RepID=UPI000ACA4A85|nr:3-oxoacyl-ACP reductase FabG [Acidithiobacillus ferrooxidans]MBU2856090.1 3-oxoacyl-ACP reductase FabG [Acidithiobacillus ferrooxidans]MBU2862198.1 3-oxoacyl-ACP reductase FabG [Acidithiobacillus ferrooxidans]MCR2831608.1 3-oxoacyl-ACP reductase FabG [Acidithiobacillus ferrooxidans]